MANLLPLFLNLTGRAVLLVGGGRVAAGKLTQLLAASAHVRVVAPEICDELAAIVASAGLEETALQVAPRPFEPADLDGAWLVVAAATPDVNRVVAAEAETRRLFVNAVDDPPNASAYLSGVVRRAGVTIAISTSGDAPALTALLREGLDALLPRELEAWIDQARAERVVWRRDAVAMDARKPRLLQALNALYGAPSLDEVRMGAHGEPVEPSGPQSAPVDRAPRVPWLSGPEDSWL